MKIIEIQHNVMNGQCKRTLVRIQVGYSAVFIGYGFLPNEWSGLRWGFFSPARVFGGWHRIGFYGSFLPGISGAVPQWPRWYFYAWRFLRFRTYGA